MVSLRYVQQQQEADARRARYEESRRMANEMCVRRARMYAAQKAQQQQKVRGDVQKEWECEVQQQAALIDRLLYDCQAKQGEGMYRAAELKQQQEQIAQNELNAWVAENQLQEERHRLARAEERITRALQQEPHRSIINRKKAVRLAEDKRSKSIAAQPRQHLPSFATITTKTKTISPLAGALSHTAITHGSNTKTNVPSASANTNTINTINTAAAAVVIVNANPRSPIQGNNNNNKDNNTINTAVVAAAQYSKERQEALAEAQATVEESRRSAAERAAAVLLQREASEREAREAARRRAANVEALQLQQQQLQQLQLQQLQRMHTGDVAEGIVPCLGEQETRRAAALRKEVEAEFESMFLRDTLTCVEGSATGTAENHNSNNNNNRKNYNEKDKKNIKKKDVDVENLLLPFPLVTVSSLLPKEGEIILHLSSKPLEVRPMEDEDYHDGREHEDDYDVDYDYDNNNNHNNNNNNNNNDYDYDTAVLDNNNNNNNNKDHNSDTNKQEEEEEDVHSDVGSDDAPCAVSLVPEPTPMSTAMIEEKKKTTATTTTTPEKKQTEKQMEEQQTSILTSTSTLITTSSSSTSFPTTSFPTTSSPQQSPSNSRNEQVELDHHHEKFLRNLKALQEKLSMAAANTDVNETAESSTLHANVSLSSMSSVITPMRLPGRQEETTGSSEIDTSAHSSNNNNSSINSSSGSSLSSTSYSPYPTMTADQLKAALLRMKMRMRSI